MNKINFVNNSTPALNATNLNQLQDNVEDAISELEIAQNNKVKTSKTTSDTDTYCCNYINNNIQDAYSTNEIKTNKVWVDGKPIYRKVLPIVVGVIENISALNCDMIRIENAYLVSRSETIYPFPYNYGNDSGFWTILQWDKTQITTGRNNATSIYCNGTAYITIEYTKTTD